MSSSVGMMTFPIYGEIKNVPKHQPYMYQSHWIWWDDKSSSVLTWCVKMMVLLQPLWSKSWIGDILSQFLTLCYGRSGREKNGWIVELNGSSCCIAMLTYRRESRLCPPENTHGSQSVQKVGPQIHVVSSFINIHRSQLLIPFLLGGSSHLLSDL